MRAKKALLFDLDGTLLPMDREEFVRAYLPGVSAAAASLGDPRRIARCILVASEAMAGPTDGAETLERVFWRHFEQLSGITRGASEALFNAYYYSPAFDRVRDVAPAEPLVRDIVAAAHGTGLRVVLATSPLFPRVATEKRVQWAGLRPEDFELISTFEDFHAAKPNRAYYEELLGRLGLAGDECIMVGNDAREDLPAPAELGMETFFLTNHAIVPEGCRYRCDHEGDYGALLQFIRSLPGRGERP